MEELNDDSSVKTTNQVKRLFSINKDMIPVKLTYFIWGCINGTFSIYLNPFFISVGIPETKAGVLTGITFAVSSIAGPVWGMVSDHTGHQKLILTMLCVIGAGSLASLPLVANTFVNPSNNAKLCRRVEYESTILQSLYISPLVNITNNNSTRTNSSNGEKCMDLNMSSTSLSNSSDDTECVYMRENESNSLFYHLVGIVTFGAAFFHPLQAFVEAIALNYIKSSPGASYGAQRIFGSIGGSVTVYATGFVIDRYPFDELSEFSMAFFSFVPFALLLIPLVFFITVRKSKVENIPEKQDDRITTSHSTALIEKVSVQLSVTRQLLSFLRRLEVVMLLLTTLVAGLSFSLFIFFTALLLVEHLKISKEETSFVFIMLTISNTITFPLSSMIIKLARGPIPIMIIGILCHGIRNIVMSYTEEYWLMLSIQLLHCFDFALFWCAVMEYMHELSPPDIKVTMTLMLNSVKFQISPFLLNIVGGVIYQKYGGCMLFRWNGVFCCAWAFLLVLFYSWRYVGRKKRKEQEVVK